ncbi:hypothetical protein T440DRAFT_433100 [Plenodomus tracheiphilus IPT5]|uniref:Zn(2)-C6 fungal-type domain-containing protein n=1 Tax=Plenodomus tracheiphilus IPT5 TaxID=1408161 RepID=A0A6A7ATS8_9PLEO|nr:hypothetical protein T440DRAFT_433100 [Plenodomus tracheiphilus IPT5]
MPPSRGHGAPGRKPRRTHNLGGCTTCRRRHVKCDQKRPLCTVCQSAGLNCEGFPSQIRWASMSTGPAPASKISRSQHGKSRSHEKRGLEAHGKPSDEDREQHVSDSSQSIAPNNNLRSDRTSLDIQQSTISVNTGGISTNLEDGTLGSDAALTNVDLSLEPNEPNNINFPSSASISDLESLFDVCNGLGWNDLFDSTMSDHIPMIHDQVYGDSLSVAIQASNRSDDMGGNHQWYDRSFTDDRPPEARMVCTTPATLEPAPPSYTSSAISELEVLEKAKHLLKHFRDVIIPQLCPLPMETKSPWEVLNWSAAVQTHADLTFLGTNKIRHATKANFFAIIGCSVHSTMREGSSSDAVSLHRNAQILEHVSRAAKENMQQSLRVETCGSQKAKYKDQLMAIFSLILLETLSGNSNEARCYLIDAERLVRLRGLAKRDVSRRARLLHHVYTWLRIIGESTFTLHGYEGSGLQTKVKNILVSSRDSHLSESSSAQETSTMNNQSQLDDFLRIETHGTDSDSEVDASRDKLAGLRDIHLASTQQWSKTLYMDIYGIPELWLKLVSQTTRVANVMDLLEKKSLHTTEAFTKSLQRKTSRLEHMICSLSAQYSVLEPLAPLQDHGDRARSTDISTSKAMLQALGSALVILFYRRVRKVHPWILQSHVTDIRNALEGFEAAQNAAAVAHLGSPWPAFIAGCEAISPSTREWFRDWMQKAAAQSACNGAGVSLSVMQEVWKRRDAADQIAHNATDINLGLEKTRVHSWVDVLRESKSWLMLY